MMILDNYAERVFEAVRWRFLVALAVLLPPLTEQQRLLVQEQMPLHGLEPGQVLHLGVTFLVLRPHTEGALHQQATQVWQVTLETDNRLHTTYKLISDISYSYLCEILKWNFQWKI